MPLFCMYAVNPVFPETRSDVSLAIANRGESMAESQSGPPKGGLPPFSAAPTINRLNTGDLVACLKAGLSDFARAPLFGLFFGGFFALLGIIILLSLTAWDMPLLIYPFAIGFPLVGPFAAVGLFEVSRRLEAGEKLQWGAVLSRIWLQRGREIAWMGMVMLFFFWMWMYQVRLLIALILGRMSFSTLEKFLTVVLTTPNGWLFLAIGHLIGGALAILLFSLTVIAIPLLMERDVDVVTAMITSVRTVLASPLVMIIWGVLVTLSIVIACLPAFLGLIFILPVLGFATWHIYRKALATE